MALDEYKRKRDFKKTAEPAPGRRKKSGKKLSFVIQKHDATRLHYDFRLEWKGVLLSWAVTRGPSLNPKDKRLAVRTEDHPIAYGDFEGIIPEGEYGGGTVMLWDQGEWLPENDISEGLKKGSLKFTLKGARLQGKWALVRMHTPDKRENWLLIKEKDEYANIRKKAETFLDEWSFSVASGRKMEGIAKSQNTWSSKKGKKETASTKAKSKTGAADVKKLAKKFSGVQLATLVDKPPQGKNWIHEIKFDGYRLLGLVSGGHVILKTRNGLDWTEKFPAIAQSLSQINAKDAVIDMEAVITDEKGRTSFQGLQNALREKENERIVAYAFDLLYIDGKDMTGLGLLERKEKLGSLLKKSKNAASILYSDHIAQDGEKMLANSCKMDLEGIISKDANSKYSTGRQKNWLKSKCTKRQEFIIIGMMAARSGGRDLGALYLGYYKGRKLSYAGKVGTGFTMKSAEDLAKKLKKMKSEKSIFIRNEMEDVPVQEYKSIHWVKPELLCEIEFTEWTDSEHIRHPSFQGLREDKSAKAVKHETPEKIKPVSSGKLILEGVEITHPER
ncbi:MAG: ATP-dependent DNA ligase, partial [Micavibrio aeruginosavorus]